MMIDNDQPLLQRSGAAGRDTSDASGNAAIRLLLFGTLLAGMAHAQEAQDDIDALVPDEPAIEEVVVFGRQQQSATDVVAERLDLDVVADYLDAASIGRVGDSDVAAALRRLPGLTVVRDQFVYVRGLGERYSSSTLNGAVVPSPDLTRSVLPLDIFPTTIIDSIQVQKGYTPDRPAAFGGGGIDIRTVGIPEQTVFRFAVGSGYENNGSNGLTYSGGSDDDFGEDDGTRALSPALNDALSRFRGSVSPEQIFRTLNAEGQNASFADAEQLNRELATELNRDVGFTTESIDPDLSGEVSLGSSWLPGSDWEVGALGVVAYDNLWRNRDQINRNPSAPEIQFTKTQRTIHQVQVTAAANLGLRFTDDHAVNTTSMLLRSTDDEAGLADGFNFNNLQADGRGVRTYQLRFEERELRLRQISGKHKIGDDTYEMFPFIPELLRYMAADWYYSDSVAETDLPSEIVFSALNDVDPATGEVLATRIATSGSSADYRYSALKDDVESYGWALMYPLSMKDIDIEIKGGWDYNRKGRSFDQVRFGLGTTTITGNIDVLQGLPEGVFTDANLLDPDNEFELTVGGIGTESYLAGQTTNASFGKADILFGDTWRLSLGARREQFNQLAVPLDRLSFGVTSGQVRTNVPLDELVFFEDDLYPAVAVTYMRPGFWADTFQLRFGWSETIARPDIREISNATYIDPLTEARVTGNSALVTSPITNFDLRGEWFFDNGNNFTVSLFAKEIDRPIEQVQQAGSDQAFALGFINAEQGEVYGAELEGLYGLGGLPWVGRALDAFFVNGNITLSDSEIDVGADAQGLTNLTRRLTQHSEYVVNLQLGYDAMNAKHSASLAYNLFGERIFFAGRNGAADAFEQPFDSLDLVYTYYPTERIKITAKLKNILDDDVEIERGGVTIFEQEIGRLASLEFNWQL